jgi:CTP:molybdopterin cytidylyltransferase MocA
MTAPVNVAGVILAAGSSRRLGRPKQLVVFAGETLLERAVRTAQQAALAPVIVVVRPEGDFGHPLQQLGCMVVVNEEADEGIATSIRRGVSVVALLKAKGIVLMTCDQVAVTAEHLRALCAMPDAACGSGYAGKIGIPAYFPASAFDALLQLRGDTGARDLLRSARAVETEALSFDVDTEEDVTRARKLLEGSTEA